MKFLQILSLGEARINVSQGYFKIARDFFQPDVKESRKLDLQRGIHGNEKHTIKYKNKRKLGFLLYR